MTVKEFWHLKIGTIVENRIGEMTFWKGKLVKRELIDECYGMIITKKDTIDLKTGRKLLQCTFEEITKSSRKYFRYVDSSRTDQLKHIHIIK